MVFFLVFSSGNSFSLAPPPPFFFFFGVDGLIMLTQPLYMLLITRTILLLSNTNQIALAKERKHKQYRACQGC
jgi:hypothetical protein